jgi:hypothetical protein
MTTGQTLKSLISAGVLAVSCTMSAQAADIGGVKVEDTATVAGKTLVLNGGGMRQIFVVKVYAAALYLAEKKTSAADVQALTTPKRVALHIQREINSDEFGQLFITSMNKNSSKEEKAKVINQTVKFGEMFSNLPPVKKGDIVTLDWVPGSGTVSTLNGKQIGETLPDIAFYNAVLRIWIGENPVQSDVKRGLLGEK